MTLQISLYLIAFTFKVLFNRLILLEESLSFFTEIFVRRGIDFRQILVEGLVPLQTTFAFNLGSDNLVQFFANEKTVRTPFLKPFICRNSRLPTEYIFCRILITNNSIIKPFQTFCNIHGISTIAYFFALALLTHSCKHSPITVVFKILIPFLEGVNFLFAEKHKSS